MQHFDDIMDLIYLHFATDVAMLFIRADASPCLAWISIH